MLKVKEQENAKLALMHLLEYIETKEADELAAAVKCLRVEMIDVMNSRPINIYKPMPTEKKNHARTIQSA